jgi:homogentisate 1,2-dioxygenase
MPYYHRAGQVPRKRHTVFREEAGRMLREELMGNQGFTGPSSLLYHLHSPTAVRRVEAIARAAWKPAADETLRLRHFRTAQVPPGGNPVEGRLPLLYNADVALLAAHPEAAAPYFYRNGMADEMIYVGEGSGVLESVFGRLSYRKGDHLVIPRGITHRLCPAPGEQRLLVLESRGVIRIPRRYRTAEGQLLEGAPYCERDFRLPGEVAPVDEAGEFEMWVKQRDRFVLYVLDHHPFDVLGWDGCYYPWAFNIEDFEPVVGRLHLPPPAHQVFEGDGFVVCDFVPRMLDFHAQAVPVPYFHTNAQSDEVIYYASGDFLSRRGIESGSITLHPDGVPHGPHPGAIESALGRRETEETAVMVDTFRPLTVSADAERLEDPLYWRSWLEGADA